MAKMIDIADLLLDILEGTVYDVAFADGKAARLAGLPKNSNPHTHLAACAGRYGDFVTVRVCNSWDAGWVFGKRGWR